MNTQQELIDALIDAGVLRSPNIIQAFQMVDRADFVLEEKKEYAYEDRALGIGYDQTISQPYTVAFMLEHLAVQEGDAVLDVGSGSGWTTALLSVIVGNHGRVYGVEIIPELAAFGKRNLAQYTKKNARIFPAKPNILGLPEFAPFDRILVSAAHDSVPPPLLHQLAEPGTLVLPVHTALFKIQRSDGSHYTTERFEGFFFVPLRTNT